MKKVIEISNLTKIYPRKRLLGKERVEAVRDFSMNLKRGEILGLLGPNGAGKTTIIKMLSGLVKPTEGNITIFAQEKKKKVLSKLGVLMEGSRNLYLKLTCRENLKYFGLMKGVKGERLKNRIEEMLGFFELEEAGSRLAGDLSRGMLQKLSLATTIIHEPEIILFDEPTLGLDVYAKNNILKLIKRLTREQQKSIIITSHLLDTIEKIADRVIILKKGQKIADKKIGELKQNYTENIVEVKVLNNQSSEDITNKVPGYIGSHIDEEQGIETHKFNIEGDDDLFFILQYIVNNELSILDIKRIEPSLEDIFITLTGGEPENDQQIKQKNKYPAS